jgi:hypothetical protein
MSSPLINKEIEMKKLLALAICVASLTLFACKEDKVSFDSWDGAVKQANENSTFNAQQFRIAHPEFSEFSLLSAPDSTQIRECPQGDGWASPSLKHPETGMVVKLKCSTVSAGVGCLLDSDFNTKSYKGDDGRCSADVPFPIPKIQK